MINVVWAEGVEGALYVGRSRYACVTMLNEQFDQFECSHWSGWERVPETDGIVCVVHGGNLRGTEEQITMRCEKYRWVIYVVIGDEENAFQPERLTHPNCRIWVQPGKPTTYGDRLFPVGYPNDCHAMLNEFGAASRDIPVFFAGQYTHQRRIDCVNAIQSLLFRDDCVVVGTHGFGQGLPHDLYFNYISRARIVPCPSGPEMPDSYRMAEALEAGAVPVIDAVSLRREPGYWKRMFGDHPLPEVQEWSEFPALAEKILQNWSEYHTITQQFWKNFKADFYTWLKKDLLSLGCPSKEIVGRFTMF